MIPYSTQKISLRDRIAVFASLGSAFLTQGPSVEKFETRLAAYVGSKHAVALNSATSALHVACLALGLNRGDTLWTTPISFVASANCGAYCGADVDFVDIDPGTFNMSVPELKRKLAEASAAGSLPKVLVVVHLAGEPAPIMEIRNLTSPYGIKVIEDASHALGSTYFGRKIGSGEFSDITIFSFHAVKNMTTGEGGMAVTNEEALANRMRLLRSHGITRDPSAFLVPMENQSPWHYEQHGLGFNFRMTDFQATLGLSQLARLEKFNKRRKNILERYSKSLSHLDGIRFQASSGTSESATHLAIICVDNTLRLHIRSALHREGFATALHYPPIHLQPFYASKGKYSLPNAENYARQAMSLPCHPKLSTRQTRKVSNLIIQEMQKA